MDCGPNDCDLNSHPQAGGGVQMCTGKWMVTFWESGRVSTFFLWFGVSRGHQQQADTIQVPA